MIKVSLIVLAGLAAAAALRKQSAAVRHWVLAVAIACAAVAPYLQAIAPTWNLAPATPHSATAISPPDEGSRATDREANVAAMSHEADQLLNRVQTSASRLIVPIWITGAVVSLLILLAGFGRLSWLASHAERVRDRKWLAIAEEISGAYGVRRPIALLRSDHPALTVTWGALQPNVILPSGSHDWPDDRIRVVLAHELAHIRRGDWLAQMIAELLRSIYWFNPLVWIAARRLRQESEQACDDAVLAQGVEGPEYAGHLLDLARAVRQHRRPLFPGFPAPAMVRLSSLERRVNAMLNTHVNRTPPARSVRIAALIGLLAVTVLIGGFGAAAQTFARFSGSVLDPTDSGIPKVTLLLVNVQSQAKHEVRSDENGRFEFVGLPPGEYLLEAQYPGFATLRGALTVTGQDVQRNLALQIGSLTETITISGSASAPSTPEPQVREKTAPRRSAAQCTPSGTGGDIRPPRKLRDVRPIYPQHLQSGRVAGTVRFDGRIGVDGMIRELRVIESPNVELANAAAEAIRQWEFASTLLNCVPVEVAIRITANFTLE